MVNMNANQLIVDAINAGRLKESDAHNLIRGAGFQDAFGGGRATNYFNTNPQANEQLLTQLNQRGLIPTQSLTGYLQDTVRNPDLPRTTSFVPQTMQVQQGELQTATPVTAGQISQQPDIETPELQTAQVQDLDDLMVGYEEALNQISQGTGQYDPTTVSGQVPQAQAAQGQVSELATVQGQLADLYADTQDGQVPIWAQGAVRKAEDVLAARGLGASSLAAGAITASIQESAINIAAQDAQTYFKMDLTNLANEQQTRLENVRLRQQALLSDQAAINAASQFNASSQQQLELFQAQLVTEVKTQNANRVASMQQFNTAEKNKMELASAQIEVGVEQFNRQQATAIEQYNTQLKFQADTFNAQQAQVVDQSNVAWRRQINTSNTASINAANQLNVQNAFNLSNYALNALWQKSRDEANWLWQSSQDALNYQRKLGQIGANRDAEAYLQNNKYDLQAVEQMYQSLGAVGERILFGV